MKRLLLLLICSLSMAAAYAQTFTVSATVMDETVRIMVGAQVRDTVHHTLTITDTQGRFEIEVQDNSVLAISFIGYATRFVTPKDFNPVLPNYFGLEPQQIGLGEALVSSERIDRIVTETHAHVLDYVPYPGFTLALKQFKKKRMLSLEGLDSTLVTYALPSKKINRLFEDCMGNIHLLSPDSSYQVYLDSALVVVDRASREEFDEVVVPCVNQTDSASVFYAYTNHNQKFSLFRSEPGIPVPHRFFETYDREAERVARIEYYAIIAYYMTYSPEPSNLILNGAWSGDLIALQIPGDWELNRMITWYLKIRARELEVYTFRKGDHVVVVDCLNNAIQEYDAAGELYDSWPLKGLNGKLQSVLMDHNDHRLYAMTVRNGIASLHAIEPTGMCNHSVTLHEALLAENIQVFDGYVYFIKDKNGWKKLYRVPLDNREG